MLERLRIGAFASLMVIALIGMSGLAASAQEGTPAADGSPMAAECVSPGLPPGTPTPMDDMEGMDMGSPEAMEGMDMASPEAMGSPEAMPMPEFPPVPEGEAADEATAAEIEEFLTNYAACLDQGWSTNDPALYVALESQNFILESTGTGNPYDRVAQETDGAFSGFDLHDVTNSMVYDDGRVSGDISGVAGNWLVNVRAVLIQEDGEWKYDEEFFLSPDVSDFESVSVVGVAITESTDESTGELTYAFTYTGGSTTFNQVEALVFTLDNTTAVEMHEAIVLQLPEGADPLGILDGSVAFEDVGFIGAVFPILPGETKELALVNLEPGVYTMICFVPGPDGAPHAANGMIAQFEIVPPAE